MVKVMFQGKFFTVAAAVMVLALAACAPPYDQDADKQITELQHKVDERIMTLISLDNKIRILWKDTKSPAAEKVLAKAKEDASYEVNVPFYDYVDTDLTSVQLRVDAYPNRATSKIDITFTDLRKVLLAMPAPGSDPTSMQAVHAAQDHLSAAFLRSTRNQVNELFGTLIQYEVTLKAGKTPSN